MSHDLKDFPYGPLSPYRDTATFDWKKMKLHINGVAAHAFADVLHAEMLRHPSMYRQELVTPPLHEQRRVTAEKLAILYGIVAKITGGRGFTSQQVLSFVEVVFAWDPSVGFRYAMNSMKFVDVVIEMGTERHHVIAERAKNGEIYGCVCYGEVAGGVRTTATYDARRRVYVIHTPDFEAAKCFVQLGKTAGYGVVYAQLVLPNGEERGVHAFLVRIHDENLKPCLGITAGDLGEKIGMNGVDTAVIIFNEYAVSRDCLLDRAGDVTENGRYLPKSEFRLRVDYESRKLILATTTSYLTKSVSIAVRYAAVRKQFGEPEVAIIEYQTHQYRLFPYVALAYAAKLFCQRVFDDDVDEALVFGGKCVLGWHARDGIQECREACGGHGYLKAAGIGEMRNANDVDIATEGANHVLVIETGKHLLKQETNHVGVGDKFSSRTMNAGAILSTFEWLERYARFKNDAKLLATTYVEHELLKTMNAKILTTVDVQLRDVLEILFALLGCWLLDKRMIKLYAGGYIVGTDFSRLVHETILNACTKLKGEAVALVDAIVQPDYVVNSVLGSSDGEVYKHLEAAVFQNPHAFGRPTWWNEIVDYQKELSKL